MLGLSVDPHKLEMVGNSLAAYPEILEVATCTGTHDMVIKIIGDNEKDIWMFINKNIKTMEAIGKDFDVSMFLVEYKNTTEIPI